MVLLIMEIPQLQFIEKAIDVPVCVEIPHLQHVEARTLLLTCPLVCNNRDSVLMHEA